MGACAVKGTRQTFRIGQYRSPHPKLFRKLLEKESLSYQCANLRILLRFALKIAQDLAG